MFGLLGGGRCAAVGQRTEMAERGVEEEVVAKMAVASVKLK